MTTASMEQIYTALAIKIGDRINTLLTTPLARRFKLWDAVNVADQPAAFQVERDIIPTQKKGFPPLWKHQVDLIIYTNVGQDPSVTPSTTFNPIVDGVKAALAPDPATGFQQLPDQNGNPQVSHAWVTDIKINEGTVDATGDQNVIVVGIAIEELPNDLRLLSFDTGWLFVQRLGSPANWVKVGALTGIDLTIKSLGTAIRSSKYQTNHGFNQTELRVDGKAKFAKVDGGLISEMIFGQAQQTGATLAQLGEAHLIPTTPFQLTIVPPSNGTFSLDLGIIDGTTGLALRRVTSNPVAGQYSLAGNVYTFAAADTGHAISVSYTYLVSTGTSLTLANQVQQPSITYRVVLANGSSAGQMCMILNAVVSQQLLFPTAIEDFTIQELDFTATADPSEILGQISFSPNN